MMTTVTAKPCPPPDRRVFHSAGISVGRARQAAILVARDFGDATVALPRDTTMPGVDRDPAGRASAPAIAILRHLVANHDARAAAAPVGEGEAQTA